MVIEEETDRVVSIKSPNSETTVKSTSADKLVLDQIVECLKLRFDCEVTSPKMYNDKKDVFFQYVTVAKRRA